MFRKAAIVLPVFAVAPLCADINVYFELTYKEVDAVTGEPVLHPNGVIEPGEGARLSLAIWFTPQVGEVIPEPWAPPGEWRLHAFRGSMFPSFFIYSSPSTPASWRSLAIAPGWGSAGSPIWQGEQVSAITLVQNAATADQRNPAEGVWQGTWVPDDYTSRTVRFALGDRNISAELSSSMWIRSEGPPEEFSWVIPTKAWSIPVYIEVGPGEPPTCYANCDNSTIEPILTVDDFTCFINEFAQAQTLPHEQQVTHYANCDGSTTAPVLTVDDFTCFINEFAQGCP